jgi:exopolysaccharide production protein ExoZ
VVEQKYSHGSAILTSSAYLGSIGIDLFFVISGFIMVTVAGDISWKKFLLDRATRIYPPYWFYTTLVLAILLLAPSLVNSSFSEAPSIWRSYLLIPDKTKPLLAVGWTLINEMYFYLCFAGILVVSRKFKSRMLTWLAIWAALIAILNLLPQSPSSEFRYITNPLTIEFIMGAMVGLLIKEGYRALGFPIFMAGIAWLCVTLMSTEFLIDDTGWKRVALVGIPSALIVYSAVAIELSKTVIAPKWLVKLGDASYSIYLSHVLVLSAMGRFYAMLPGAYLSEVVFLIVSVCAANVVGLLSYYYVERMTLSFVRDKLKFSNRPASGSPLPET